MKVGDTVLAREGASYGKMVPARGGAEQRKEEREAREDSSAQEGPWSGEETEEARAELSLVVVPFE